MSCAKRLPWNNYCHLPTHGGLSLSLKRALHALVLPGLPRALHCQSLPPQHRIPVTYQHLLAFYEPEEGLSAAVVSSSVLLLSFSRLRLFVSGPKRPTARATNSQQAATYTKTLRYPLLTKSAPTMIGPNTFARRPTPYVRPAPEARASVGYNSGL